jgi:1-acyl-sn-glycerol-3-phosphate acyltransferase
VAETRAKDRETRARLETMVRERVVDALGIPPDTIVLAAPGSVLKTSSGKVRRAATREAWRRGWLGRRRSTRMQRLRLLTSGVAARAARVFEWAERAAFGVWVGLLLLVTTPPLWALVLLLRGRAADAVVRRWCRMALALAGCRLRVVGAERLPAAGPIVFAANHASYLDAVVLLAAIARPFRFVAKRELGAWPVVGAIIGRAGHLKVERADPSRSVEDARRVTDALRGGDSLFFFPEGTFVARRGLLPFRLGTFKAAVEARCPVVPVAIRGTRAILPSDAWLPRRGPITVTIGPPIAPLRDDWREILRLRDAVRAAIAAGTGE